MDTQRLPDPSAPQEGYLPLEGAELYYRAIGDGQPMIVLHGGPDFDHSYLLPELDRLADRFRLIYYDQRGRGRSAGGVPPEAVTLQSEIADVESLRDYFRLDSVALLGNSWGALLALEYALHHSRRVSHLILLNSAPASHDDYLLFRQERRTRAAGDLDALAALAATTLYQAGDPDTVAAYYRIHFRAAFSQPAQLEQVIARLRASFTRSGILKARAIEARLMAQTWLRNDYNLLPELTRLPIPTLVLHGADDFVPLACAAHIAQAIPNARLVVLADSGHFSYLECPDRVHDAINTFIRGPDAAP